MLTRDLLMTSTLLLAVGIASAQNNHTFRPEIPRVWDERALKEMELPVVMPKYSPKPVSAEYYYRIPVRTIYKSYPIYAPGRTLSGYLDRLKTLEPEIAFDRARLQTKDDWIRAGEIVFEAPTEVDEDGPFAKAVSDPLPNPKPADKQLIAAGKKIFEREGCAGCHTPPLYTNNKLTPAQGFSVPADHRSKYDILPVVIGTDPRLTMETRRGTGYYEVPSLRGLWYRGPFEHNGSVATLEDWFDPHRLRDDYVPTGFKGYGVKARAVPGHEFGLKLAADDKKALT